METRDPLLIYINGAPLHGAPLLSYTTHIPRLFQRLLPILSNIWYSRYKSASRTFPAYSWHLFMHTRIFLSFDFPKYYICQIPKLFCSQSYLKIDYSKTCVINLPYSLNYILYIFLFINSVCPSIFSDFVAILNFKDFM